MRLVYVVNNLGFFVSHRLSLAMHAKESGFNVLVIAGAGGSETLEAQAEKVMTSCGINFKRLKYRGASFRLIDDLIGLLQLCLLMARLAPNLIHCISPKGVLYGGIASKFYRRSFRVFSISGMGTLFTDLDSKSSFIKLLSWAYRMIFRIVIAGKRTVIIVQNSQDFLEMKNKYSCETKVLKLIPGVGVRVNDFRDIDWGQKENLILLPARMIWEKGIREFVGAANRINELYPNWRFVLAGIADYEHPKSVPIEWLQNLSKSRNIQWIGHCENMVAQYKKARIVCLPSYREGFPKVLMEAAAAGCAVVASNAAGCKEAIIEGVTGDLVDIKNEQQLFEKLLLLIENPEIIKKYALAGRQMAFENFDEKIIIKKTSDIYFQFFIH